jgi:hypothetical protein
MGEGQISIPLLTEREWKAVLTGLSLAEAKGREDLQCRRISSAFLAQEERGLPLSSLVLKKPTPEQEKEDNDFGKYFTDLTHKLYRLRGALAQLEQQQLHDQIRVELEGLFGEDTNAV